MSTEISCPHCGDLPPELPAELAQDELTPEQMSIRKLGRHMLVCPETLKRYEAREMVMAKDKAGMALLKDVQLLLTVAS